MKSTGYSLCSSIEAGCFVGGGQIDSFERGKRGMWWQVVGDECQAEAPR